MSEKIYAYLLRLFPSAFRRHYEEQSIQLLRDRLSDEKGFFSRLRLSFDLIVDLIAALPQAYSNTYAEVAPVELTPGFDGTPSFRSLEQEPMRRGTIMLASVLSLTTALAALTSVMAPPTRYLPTTRNGRVSPIEAVLARLNGAIAPDSAGSVHADAPRGFSAESEPPKAQPLLATKATPSLDTIPAPIVATSPAQAPGAQQVAQRQPESARNVLRGPLLSGRWATSMRAGDNALNLPREFLFRQNNAVLGGSGLTDSATRLSIMNGRVTGDSVRFELEDGRLRLLYDLKVDDQELRGSVVVRTANQVRTATVRLERTH